MCLGAFMYRRSGFDCVVKQLRMRYTVVWEISVFNNFCMLKFRMGKFSYNSICTKNFQDKILSPEKELIRSCIHDGPGHVCMHITHGGDRKKLLYSRLPRMQRDMAGSYGRGAGV